MENMTTCNLEKAIEWFNLLNKNKALNINEIEEFNYYINKIESEVTEKYGKFDIVNFVEFFTAKGENEFQFDVNKYNELEIKDGHSYKINLNETNYKLFDWSEELVEFIQQHIVYNDTLYTEQFDYKSDSYITQREQTIPDYIFLCKMYMLEMERIYGSTLNDTSLDSIESQNKNSNEPNYMLYEKIRTYQFIKTTYLPVYDDLFENSKHVEINLDLLSLKIKNLYETNKDWPIDDQLKAIEFLFDWGRTTFYEFNFIDYADLYEKLAVDIRYIKMFVNPVK